MTGQRGEQQGVGAVGKAIDAVGGVVGTMKAGLGAHSDSAFVANASRGDVYGIEAARIAQQRARSPELKQLAQRMLKDHTDSTARLMAALERHGDNKLLDEVRGDLDAHRQSMVDHLREATDEEFDSVYLKQQALAHREAITLFEGFDASDDHPELVQYARAMLPVLHEHKAMVERLDGSNSVRS